MATRRFQGSGRGRGDKKSFIAKFKRKGEGGSTFKKGNEGQGATGKTTHEGRPKPGDRFSKEKKFDKPFARKTREGFSGKPGFESNRAFSAKKKYFRKREDGGESKQERGNSRFERDAGKPIFKPSRKFKRPGDVPDYSKPKRFSSAKKSEAKKFIEKSPDGLIRLNKFISNSGICSRREADELIKMGLVSVNGQVITEMGHKVKPTDDVRYENKKLTAEKPVYILLNKPKGFITTTDDPQERKTVMHLIGNAVKERIYPVGRLDRNTTGLLLLTNDGELAERLTHPSYKAKKIYRIELDKDLTEADFDKIVEGIRFEEGKAAVDDLAYVDGDRRVIGIEIHIGWNRIVRRIFEALGYEVIKLDRVVYAGLDKKNLGRGEWRFLKQDEVTKLKHLKH